MSTMTSISSKNYEQLEALPHGATVTIPGSSELLLMSRDTGARAVFECFDGDSFKGFLYPHTVFEFYQVDTVTVTA